MESLAKYLNQQGFRCHALDRKVKVELCSFGQFVYIVKDYQSGCYIVQSHVTIQLISFVSMFGVGLYGLAAQGSALSAVIAAISLGGLINLILIEVKALPLKRILQQLSNISSEEVENSH